MEDQTKALQKYYTGRTIRRSGSSRRRILQFFDKFYYIPWLLLIAIILVYPAIYCGGKFWFLPLVSLSVSLIWIFSFLSLSAHRRSLHSLYWHPGLLLFLLPVGWGLFQLFPLGGLLSWFSSSSARLWFEAASLDLGSRSCISLSPQSTWQQLHLLIVCGAVFYILMNLARSRYNIRWLMLILTSSTFLVTILSLGSYFFVNASEMSVLGKAFSGGFLNRNHFACFLGMGIFANIGLILSLVCEHDPDNPYDFSWKKLLYPLFFALFLQLMALLLTLSRGGTLTVGLGVIFMAFCWICFGRAHKDSRQKILAFCCILVSALIAAMPFVLELLSERFSEISGDGTMMTDDRWLLWKNAMLVLRDFFWTGCGLGSFGDVIQIYESGNITAGYIVYAHNDWLQLLVEMGGPFMLVFLGLLVWTAGRTLRRICTQSKTFYRWSGLAAFTALVVASMHELVDFNLQSYPNALIFTVLLAVFFICGRKERSYDEIVRDGRPDHFGAVAFLVLAAVLCLLVLPLQYRSFMAGIYHTRLFDLMHDEKNIWKDSPSFGKKLMTLSEKARHYAPENASVLRRSADVYLLELARNPDQEEACWKQSWDFLLKACRLRPFHGEDIYMLSMVYSRGRNWMPDYSMARQADLYEWVMKCQPTVLDTAYDMAVSYYYLYVEARRAGSVKKEALEHYRDRSLQLFALSFHDENAGRRQLVFDMIWYLMPDASRLLKLLPESYELREQLLRFLIRGNYRRDAELVLQHMEQILSGDKEGELYVEHFYQLQILRRNLLLMQPDERPSADVIRVFQEAARARELQKWQQLKKEEFRSPDEFIGALWDLVQEDVFSEEIIVEGAQMLQRQGSVSEMVMLLINLTYGNEPPEQEILLTADQLVRRQYSFARPGIIVRHRFLQNVLPIMLQEWNPGRISADKLYHHVVLLEELLAEMELHPEMNWSQSHLIPFYMGRGMELLNVPSRAMECYRKALKMSPRNLWIQQRLGAICYEDGAYMPGDAEKLYLLNEPAGLLAHYDRSMALLSRKIVPESIIDTSQSVDMTFRFLCNAPLPRDIQWKLVCRINDRPFFSSLLSTGTDRHSITWKAGEVVTAGIRFAPMLEALKQSAVIGRNAPVILELAPVLTGSERPLDKDREPLVMTGFLLKFH